MNVLLDTNVVSRMAQPGHSHHRVALDLFFGRQAVDEIVPGLRSTQATIRHPLRGFNT